MEFPAPAEGEVTDVPTAPDVVDRETALEVIGKHNELRGISLSESSQSLEAIDKDVTNVGSLVFSDEDVMEMARKVEPAVRMAEANEERRSEEYAEFLRGHAGRERQAIARRQDIQEQGRVAEFKGLAAPGLRKTDERYGAAVPMEEEVEVEEEAEIVEPGVDDDIPVKSVEEAQATIVETPEAQESVEAFGRGEVESIDDMPFTRVRALASLSDPRGMGQDLMSALQSRYEREATPTGIFDLIQGGHKERAAKRFREELGLYAGQATKAERLGARRISATEGIEKRRAAALKAHRRSELGLGKIGQEIKIVEEQRKWSKLPAEMEELRARSWKHLRQANASGALTLLRKVQTRKAQVEYMKLLKKLNRSLTPSAKSVIKYMVNPHGIMVPGVHDGDTFIPVGKPGFNEALSKAGGASGADLRKLKAHSKNMMTFKKGLLKGAKGGKTPAQVRAVMREDEHTLNALLKSSGGKMKLDKQTGEWEPSAKSDYTLVQVRQVLSDLLKTKDRFGSLAVAKVLGRLNSNQALIDNPQLQATGGIDIFAVDGIGNLNALPRAAAPKGRDIGELRTALDRALEPQALPSVPQKPPPGTGKTYDPATRRLEKDATAVGRLTRTGALRWDPNMGAWSVDIGPEQFESLMKRTRELDL